MFGSLDRTFLRQLLVKHSVISNDQMVCRWTKNDLYTVKSGYFVAKQLLSNVPLNRRSGFSYWDKIWHLKLPHKLQFFAWKQCNQALASKDRLLAKGMVVEPSKQIWASFLHGWAQNAVTDFCNWLCSVFENVSEDELRLFIIISWWTWKNRNSSTFKGVCARPGPYFGKISAWIRLQKDLDDATLRRQPAGMAAPTALTEWKPPLQGSFKVNFDAAYDIVSMNGFVRCVLRDSDGLVIEALCDYLGLAKTSPHAEALAARRALSLLTTLDVQNLTVEGDSLELINQLFGMDTNYLGCGNIINDVKCIARTLNSFPIFSHVKRGGKRLAHS